MKDMAGGKTLKVAAVKGEEPKRKRQKPLKISGGDNHSEVNDIPPLLAAKGEKGGEGFKGHPDNYERGFKGTPKGGKGTKGEGTKGG